MAIKSFITDPTTGRRAEVVDGIYPHALAVATRPLTTYENSIEFFTNDEEGAEMNVNAGSVEHQKGYTMVRIAHCGLHLTLLVEGKLPLIAQTRIIQQQELRVLNLITHQLVTCFS